MRCILCVSLFGLFTRMHNKFGRDKYRMYYIYLRVQNRTKLNVYEIDLVIMSNINITVTVTETLRLTSARASNKPEKETVYTENKRYV